jgi:hypothetical protein
VNGTKKNGYVILVGEPEGKRPLRRSRRRWVYNIKLDLGEIVRGRMDWIIYLAEEWEYWRALVKTVTNRRVP